MLSLLLQQRAKVFRDSSSPMQPSHWRSLLRRARLHRQVVEAAAVALNLATCLRFAASRQPLSQHPIPTSKLKCGCPHRIGTANSKLSAMEGGTETSIRMHSRQDSGEAMQQPLQIRGTKVEADHGCKTRTS